MLVAAGLSGEAATNAGTDISRSDS